MPSPTAESLIDRVDDADRPVGVVPRGLALRRGANFRTVHVFVFDRTGRLLLQRLSPKRRRHPDRWGSSVAAYLHAHETYRQAARRRIEEELGITPDLELFGKTKMRDERSLKFIELFVTQGERAQIREPSHIAELRYWTPREIESTMRELPASFTPTFRHVYRLYTAVK